VTATALGSIPSSERLEERKVIGPVRHPVDDPIAAVVTPRLDALAISFWNIASDVSDLAGSLPAFARIYLRSVGLGQQWVMFGTPPTNDVYVRLRYFVGSQGDDTPTWAASELVFPASREDQVRLGKAYWDKHRDKAVMNATTLFRRRLQARTESDSNLEHTELPKDLAPVLRYFARRFQLDHLEGNERILRTEFWYGSVANLPRGTPVNVGVRDARLAALQRYYDGPIENRLAPPPYGPVYALEREADIRWSLQYSEDH
jgi:hypothetical protein